ncbi:nitroreductase family protein, partial [bacterium]|nr:nitroreductase family protein [bacterium]
MNLFEAIRSRRSVRRFKDQPIPDELLAKILDAGCSAPSACNRQLWEFVVVSKAETRNRIADEACYGQFFIKQAPVLVVAF